MNRERFHRGKHVVSVSFRLDDASLSPERAGELGWARLRVFSDGSADACLEGGGTPYGFDRAEFAAYFLAEDEHRRLDGLDEEDVAELGIDPRTFPRPEWRDRPTQPFEYLGTY